EPAPLQVFAEGVGLLRPRRNLAQRPGTILSRRSTYEPPLVRVEAAELVLHAQERTRVRDGGLDLQPVAHDPGVPEELRHLPRVEARDASRFRRIVIQLRPACAPSRTRNSKSVRSSCTGTPHSSSW